MNYISKIQIIAIYLIISSLYVLEDLVSKWEAIWDLENNWYLVIYAVLVLIYIFYIVGSIVIMFKRERAYNLAIIILSLQTFSFTIFGIKYIATAGVHLILNFHLKLKLSFSFLIGGEYSIGFLSGDETRIGINFVSLILIILLMKMKQSSSKINVNTIQSNNLFN